MNTYTLIGSAALKCTRSQRPGDAATTLLVDMSRRKPAAVRQMSPLQSLSGGCEHQTSPLPCS